MNALSRIWVGTVIALATWSATPVMAEDANTGSGASWQGLRCVLDPAGANCKALPMSTSATNDQKATKLALVGTTSSKYTISAWNDLGMHCVDGKDYSILSILPPYNNLHAQVIDRSTGKKVRNGLVLTYEALADPAGSINTESANKTNFWQYVKSLYGAAVAPNRGLNLANPAVSNPTPSKTPVAMGYNSAHSWFEAEGLPITPYDDAGIKNYYPMVKVVAKDKNGNILASTQTVLPVSDEMTCKSCHASGGSVAAKPAVQGWAYTLRGVVFGF